MNQERLMTLVLGPHVSEKSTSVADAHNQVVFKVRPEASKPEIAQAIELLFEVKVDAVRVANQRGKIRRFGGRTGRRSSWKKAYVTLAEGHDIEFLTGE